MAEETFSFKKEISRKVVHLSAIFFIIIYSFFSHYFNHNIAIFSLIILLFILIMIDYFRVELKCKIPFFHYFFREKEKNRLGGNVYFLMGAIIVFAGFHYLIAVCAILMTIFGDMAAALIGKKYGKNYLKHFPSRAWEGILAEFSVNIFVGMIVFYFFLGISLNIFLVVILMSITATFIETTLSYLDDNLLIPIFSGLFGQVLFLLIGFGI